MILGIINLFCALLNIMLAFINYENRNYKLALFCAWVSGFCFAVGIHALIHALIR